MSNSDKIIQLLNNKLTDEEIIKLASRLKRTNRQDLQAVLLAEYSKLVSGTERNNLIDSILSFVIANNNSSIRKEELINVDYNKRRNKYITG